MVADEIRFDEAAHVPEGEWEEVGGVRLNRAEVAEWLEDAEARRRDDLRPDSRAEIAARLRQHRSGIVEAGPSSPDRRGERPEGRSEAGSIPAGGT